MLRLLHLQNFRCFRDHRIEFKDRTVVVGKNNAGKSSVIEALLLLERIVNRKGGSFEPAPSWSELSRFHRCIRSNVTDLDLNPDTLFHRYGEPPARLTARWDNGVAIEIQIGREQHIAATVYRSNQPITTMAQFLQLDLPWIYVLPQIAPLQREEMLLSDAYIQEHYYTRLASRHFRNQLSRGGDNFQDFKELAESTWHGLQLNSPTAGNSKTGVQLSILVRDGDFTAEVGWMGHGLQMWLQIMWFVSRTPHDSVVVLDEPDVYMHPDLQRKLFRLLSRRFEQCIIATHSVEIMAEAEPSNILVIDKAKRRSEYANSQPGLQALIDRIGGIHNVHLARLWTARKFLIIEGEDLAILKGFHAALFPGSEFPLDAIPNLPIGGWQGWGWAVGSSMTLRNAMGDKITTYCILDSDYHTAGEIQERYDEARERGINLHVWSRKEIENYLVVPSAIQRLIKKRMTGEGAAPTLSEIEAEIDRICSDEKDNLIDSVAAAIHSRDRRLDLSTANKQARQKIATLWVGTDGKIGAISGKQILSQLSAWSTHRFEVSFGPPAIVRQIRAAEINDEIIAVLTAIERSEPFDAANE